MKETFQIIGIMATGLLSAYVFIFGNMHIAITYFGKGDYVVGVGILSALAFFFIVMYIHHLWESYRWNGGICRECGEDWIYAWTDSGMNNAYKCGNGHMEIISYKNAKYPPCRIHLK